jgi:hypothetical protein
MANQREQENDLPELKALPNELCGAELKSGQLTKFTRRSQAIVGCVPNAVGNSVSPHRKGTLFAEKEIA